MGRRRNIFGTLLAAFFAAAFSFGFVSNIGDFSSSNGAEPPARITVNEVPRQLAILPTNAERPYWNSDRIKRNPVQALICRSGLAIRTSSVIASIEPLFRPGFKPAEIRVISDRAPPPDVTHK